MPIVTTFVCYLAIGYSFSKSEVTGIVGPLVIVFIISYFVSCVFSEIFGMGIETILYCFIADEEMFPVGSRYAEAELIGTLAATNAAHAEMKAAKAAKAAGKNATPTNVANITYDNKQKYPDSAVPNVGYIEIGTIILFNIVITGRQGCGSKWSSDGLLVSQVELEVLGVQSFDVL